MFSGESIAVSYCVFTCVVFKFCGCCQVGYLYVGVLWWASHICVDVWALVGISVNTVIGLV